MVKITEIRETYIIKRRVQENGTEKFIEEIQTHLKEVPVVDGLPRLIHFFIDGIFIITLKKLLDISIEFIFHVKPDPMVFGEDLNFYNSLWTWLITGPLFYFIFEASMQTSPAKAIFGRVVVNEYGNKPSVKQILIRSVSRAVPFEAFSCLSPRGWHDTWSKTFVIRKKDLKLLKFLQKINTENAPHGPKE